MSNPVALWPAPSGAGVTNLSEPRCDEGQTRDQGKNAGFLPKAATVHVTVPSFFLPSQLNSRMQWFFTFSGYRTASVIIALTDGELHEDLFFYAEREVRYLQRCYPA